MSKHITSITLRDAADKIAAYRKLHGPAALFFRGKVKSLSIELGDYGQVYAFGGSLPVCEIDPRKMVNKQSQEPNFGVYILNDRVVWTVTTVDGGGCEFEIVPQGEQPSVPEATIDAAALWPAWVTKFEIAYAAEQAKAVKQPTVKQPKARSADEPIVTVGGLQAQINELLARMAADPTKAAEISGELASLAMQQKALRDNQEAKRNERLEATIKAEAEKQAQAERDAAKARFDAKFGALLASRRQKLDVAQAALDALLNGDELDAEAIKRAKAERDLWRELVSLENVTAEVEQSIAAEDAKPAEPVAEQPAEQVPVESELTAGVVASSLVAEDLMPAPAKSKRQSKKAA